MEDKFYIHEETKEVYVSLKNAKLLKKLGFEWEGHGFVGSEFYPNSDVKNWNDHHNVAIDYMFTVPTQSQALKWLRDVKHIIIEAEFAHHNYFLRYVDTNPHYTIGDGHWQKLGSNEGYDSYEEALETGIEKCLEMILMKDNI
jgi:hypothetical protein